jgi:anaerobic ribonucleoside-triphosphate reductase activating protein
MRMHYSKIERADTQNGIGIRTTLFVSGCTHCCPNCHNKSTWNFKAGQKLTQEVIDKILASIDNDYVDGLTLSGGDPLHPKNTPSVANLVSQFRRRFGDTKNIWCWTGYLLEDLKARTDPYTAYVLSEISVLVDGPFMEALKDPSLKWRGSSNQRVIHLTNPS